jgi:hypothetical protein
MLHACGISVKFSEIFVFAKIFEKISRKFGENVCANKHFRDFAKIVPFSHYFRIYAKMEKCIFFSTLIDSAPERLPNFDARTFSTVLTGNHTIHGLG